MNPGPASGSLETIGTTDESVEILVENATAGEEEFVGVGDFWDGSTQGYNTGAIRYRPGYNLYNNAPRTVYEHSLLYNEFEREESTLPVTGQALIDDDRITLIALNGSLSENRVDRASVDIKPVSTQTRTVDVTDQGGSISIHLPTRLGVEDWQSVLRDEDNVVGVSESNELETGVKIELDDGVEYQLQMAKVGVGTQVTETDGAYIAGVDGDGAEITEGDTHELTVEVRDDYNNPKRGVTVNASADEGDLEETEKNTRVNGKAKFKYDSEDVDFTSDEVEDQINFSITQGYEPDLSHNPLSVENLTMDLTIKQEPRSQVGEGNVSGPKTTVGDNYITIYQGEQLEFEAFANSIGTETQPRSGTPIHHIWLESDLENVDRDQTEYSENPDDWDRNVSHEFSLDTDEWELEEHDITVRVQDASGRITPDEDAGILTVNVTEPPEEAVSSLSDLDIAGQGTDATITQGENEDVSVNVTNVGGEAGSFEVTLDIGDGEVTPDPESTGELSPGDSETVTFESVTGELEDSNYQVNASTENDFITGDLTVEEEEDSPTFDSLSAEVTEFHPGNNDWIREITIDGTVENPDTTGEIKFEVTADGANLDDSPRTIDMVADFEPQEFDGEEESEIDVIVRLLDSDGNIYQECVADRSLQENGNNEELTLADGDFSCS